MTDDLAWAQAELAKIEAALAFCRWLTEQLQSGRTPVRVWSQKQHGLVEVAPASFNVYLPSEAEWEKAARGTDGRAFPWGDEPDPERANYDGTGIGTTSPVGCFPGGASPYGVEDQSGNVWEWTRSSWGEDWGNPEFGYPYDPDDGRENLSAGHRRVLRGGSFINNLDYVRCAYRLHRFPNLRFAISGFRLVAAHSSLQREVERLIPSLSYWWLAGNVARLRLGDRGACIAHERKRGLSLAAVAGLRGPSARASTE